MPFIMHRKVLEARKFMQFLCMLLQHARSWASARVMVGNKAYVMVDPAHVHGIMDGELAAEVERGERVLQEFLNPMINAGRQPEFIEHSR